MTGGTYREFVEERERLNKLVLDNASLDTKRFFRLDSQVYRDGALSRKVKEMLGLTASIVLRCDDCISYHLTTCAEAGVTDEELQELISVALVAGGSITIPHIRRAVSFWADCTNKAGRGGT